MLDNRDKLNRNYRDMLKTLIAHHCLSLWVNAVISLCSAAGWRRRSGEYSSNIPLKIILQIAQWVEQLTYIQVRIQLVNRFFTFACMFLKTSFDSTVTWHSKHALKQDLGKIKCRSFEHIWSADVERRQGTAVVHSCQNHIHKQWLGVDLIPN